jgi:hypothetical protein
MEAPVSLVHEVGPLPPPGTEYDITAETTAQNEVWAGAFVFDFFPSIRGLAGRQVVFLAKISFLGFGIAHDYTEAFDENGLLWFQGRLTRYSRLNAVTDLEVLYTDMADGTVVQTTPTVYNIRLNQLTYSWPFRSYGDGIRFRIVYASPVGGANLISSKMIVW